MQKIKSKLIYILGGAISFIYKQANIIAYEDRVLYGVESVKLLPKSLQEPTLWEKVIDFILSPIFVAIVVVLSLVVGCIFFFKRKVKQLK